MSDYVISATLELKDKLTAKINDAKKGMDSFKSSASGVSGSLDAAQGAMAKTGLSAVKAAADTDRLKRSLQGVKGDYAATVSMKDNLSAVAGKAKENLRGLDGKSVSATIGVKDSASSAIMGIKNSLQGMKSDYPVTVSARDNTSAEIKGIKGNLQGLKGVTVPVNLKDEASAGISRIKNELTSLAGRPIMPQLSIQQNVRGLEIPAIQPKNVTVDVTGRINSNLSAAAEQVKGALRGIRPSYSVTLSAKDEASRVANGAKNTLQGIRGAYSATISAKDNASATADRAQGKLQGIRNNYTASIFAKDNASNVIGKVKTGLHDVSGQYSATISAKDDASGVVGRVRSGLQGLQGRAASTSVHLRDEASAGIARVKEELTGLTGKAYTAVLNFKQNTGGLSGMGEKAAGMVSGVANGMLMNTSMQVAGAAGIGFGIYDTLKTSMNFDAALSGVKALVPAGEDAAAVMKAVKEEAMELGQETVFGDTDVARGMSELLKAGLDLQTVLNGGAKAAMNLATAGDLSLEESAQVMSTAMNAFHEADPAHAANILSGAANASATSVHEMSYAMAASASVAAALGMSFEDANATLAVFAQNGLKGSDAGTSLKTMLMNLQPQTKQATDLMKQLGIVTEDGSNRFFDATGHMKSMAEVAGVLHDAVKDMNPQQQQDVLIKLFGTDAVRGATLLAKSGAEGINSMTDAMKRFTAEDIANTKMDNLKGDIEQLSGSWENFQIKLMDGKATSGLRGIVTEATGIVDTLSSRLEDGLDFGDIFAVAAKGITDLKDKFLQLDGIGSVLSGGALAFGLYKIIGLTKKAVSAVKDLFSARAGKSGGASAGGATAAREIVINASSVVVNGKSVVGAGGGKAGGPVPVPSGGRNTPAPVPAGGWRSAAISVAKGGALAALFAGLDIYSTHSENQQKLAEAASGLDAATDNLKNLRESGASQEEIQIAEQGVEEAKQYQADTQSYADLSMDQSVGSGIGGIIGAGIGGALMGPVGMAVGGFIGSVIGDKIGERFHAYASNDLEAIKKEVEPESKADDYDRVGMGEEPEMPVRVVAPDADDVTQAVQDTEDKIADVNLTDLDDNAGIGLWQSLFGDTSAVTNACSEVQSTVESSNDAISDDASETSSELSSYAEESSSYMSESYSDSADNTESAWSPVPGWFSGSVFGPTASGADNCGSDVSQSFSASATNSESAWSGVVSWFQSNVWGPLVQGAASAARQMANYISQAAASARSSGHTTIASGLDWVGNNLAWIGGGSYEHRASGASYYSGGWTEINEQGGEIVDLPRGSRIYPHATTVRMLKEMMEPAYQPALSMPSLGGMLDDMTYRPEPSQPVDMQPEPAYQPELPPQQIVVNTSQDSAHASTQPPTINITGNSFTVREEADIDKIAYQLMQLIQKAQSNMNYVGQGAFV